MIAPAMLSTRRRATGFTVGEWVDRALAKAAEEALHPSPPAATREDVAEVVREQLVPILARLEALEEKADRAARVQGAAPGRRRLPEEVKGRIEELHRAGRSAYAISKELGVSYKTVRARVRTLEEAG